MSVCVDPVKNMLLKYRQNEIMSTGEPAMTLTIESSAFVQVKRFLRTQPAWPRALPLRRSFLAREELIGTYQR